jgi:hypothetical protein
MKLELNIKHLAPYLPYGVKINQHREDINSNYQSELVKLSADKLKVISERFPYTEELAYYEAKPILRNLSDITKEIEVNGEMFIPIIELAKIADCDTTDDECVFFNDGKTFGVRFNIENDDDSYTHEVFAFDDYNTFGKHKRRHKNDNNGTIFHCPNQYKIYQKLFEWHFDVFDLLSHNLAIDINTLIS